jgi:Putative peptidoglycan binding domain
VEIISTGGLQAEQRLGKNRDAKGQMALFTKETHFVVYMNAKDPRPSQELHSREALAPVFADLKQYDATTGIQGDASIFPWSIFVHGDDGRFRDHDFGHHGNFRDSDERHHRHFFNDFDFVAFGFPDWWYPDYGYVDYRYSDEDADNDTAQAYGDQYWEDLAMKVQWALSRRGYYHGPIDGVVGADGISAIRAFQEAQGLPATGRVDPNVLRALKLPIPEVVLRSN